MTSIFVDWSPENDDAAGRQIADLVLPHREKFISDLFDTTVADMPDLATSADDRTLLYASIAENTAVLIATLADGSDPSALRPPPGASAYARELARRGVSLSVLLRAYRIGQAKFTAMCLDVANDSEQVDDLAALRIVVSKVAAFIDRICEVVTVHYEDERERWITSQSGLTYHWISRILSGALTDGAAAGSALDYPFNAVHLAIEIWLPDRTTAPADAVHALTAAVQLLRHHSPGSHLLSVPLDTTALSAWITQPPKGDLDLAEIRAVLATSKLPICAAAGAPGRDVAGFRSTRRQALRVKELMHTAHPEAPKFVAYRDIAPVVMLTGDPDEERGFVALILGSLADNTDRAHELRETLRNYIACNRSTTTTAARMVVHRNTISYRVQQASDELGINLDDTDLFALSAALEICRWRGASVLVSRSTGSRPKSDPAIPFRLARRRVGRSDTNG
jgi:hypothetical protein